MIDYWSRRDYRELTERNHDKNYPVYFFIEYILRIKFMYKLHVMTCFKY